MDAERARLIVESRSCMDMLRAWSGAAVRKVVA
jgi:hypothetical protein